MLHNTDCQGSQCDTDHIFDKTVCSLSHAHLPLSLNGYHHQGFTGFWDVNSCRDSSSRRCTEEHNSWIKDSKFVQFASALRYVLYSLNTYNYKWEINEWMSKHLIDRVASQMEHYPDPTSSVKPSSIIPLSFVYFEFSLSFSRRV